MSALSINSLLGGLQKPEVSTAGLNKAIIDRYNFIGNRNPYKRHEYHEYSNYGHGGHKGGKRSIALSALTLLSFLFFLHILQTCIQEHMDNMNSTTNTQVIIMQARLEAQRRAEAQKRKVEEGSLDLKPYLYTNSTIDKESRTNSFSDDLEEVGQIPVKLKIVDKKRKNN